MKNQGIRVQESKSMVVIADTHLGVKNSVNSRPLILSKFIRWLKELETNPIEVSLGGWGSDGKKVLRPLEYLLLLGDIIELWDSTDRSVDLCTRSLINTLNDTGFTKIYILGNHDNDLSEFIWSKERYLGKEHSLEAHYPMGKSRLEFYEDLYPPQPPLKEKGQVEELVSVQIGQKNYLFLHGHQFDRFFTLPSWRWMPSFRRVAQSFGSYTWLFVLLLIIDLFTISIERGLNLLDLLLTLFLASLTIPFLVIQFGRKIWNKLRTRKYDRVGGISGFNEWWRKTSKKLEPPAQDLNIVYGHTHITDIISSPEELTKILKRTTSFQGNLINLPAWCKDLSEDREEVLQAVFLYMDEEHSLLFGWDWILEKPFLIPQELVKLRRAKKGVVSDDETAEKLREIGWPEPLIDEWRNPSLI